MKEENGFVCFYSKTLKIHIAIIFQKRDQEREKDKKVKLERIQFFKMKKEVMDYSKQEKMKLYEIEKLREEHPIKKLYQLLILYFSGEKVSWNSQLEEIGLKLDLENKFTTEFSKKVIIWVKNEIEFGNLVSYSEIGNNINSKAYRAIGSVVKRNPYPIIIPCHRIIRKNGQIGGFMGDTKEGWKKNIKKDLIELERID
jgi:methylated-DNA-[protein]-cysteine S-methyltransferase